jgi:hypothetical protein
MSGGGGVLLELAKPVGVKSVILRHLEAELIILI